ncbi:MAG: hypothetical protein NW226_06235 [Microscillaceae bacterium]|nr:hypothetical protein [Microscillaceae bacterium]
MQEKTYKVSESSQDLPQKVKLALSPPPTEDTPLLNAEHSISEDLLHQAKNLAQKTGQAPEFVLSDLIRRNTAWMVLQNFLITDLLVKGSLLTFNFWLFQHKNPHLQELNIEES